MSYEQPTEQDTGKPASNGNLFIRNQGEGNILGYYNERGRWQKIANIGNMSLQEYEQKEKEKQEKAQADKQRKMHGRDIPQRSNR